MAVKVLFDNRVIVEPGAYARIISGVPEQEVVAASGKTLVIDTGSGAGYGGGAGIAGELQQGGKSVYEVDNVFDARRFFRGGLWWDLADYLFNPNGTSPGIQSLIFVRAAQTFAATLPFSVSGGAGAGARAAASIRLSSTGLAIAEAGSGYTDGVYTCTVVGGVFTAAATVEVTVSGGIVTAVTLLTAGSYTVAPIGSLEVTGLPVIGSGATFTGAFELGSIAVLQGGSSYGAAPTVNLIGGNPVTPGAATATVSGGAVTAVTAGSAGAGYTHAPAVQFVVSTSNGGALVIKARAEGTTGNGSQLASGQLTHGFAARLSAGRVNPNAFILQLFSGSFRGINENGEPFDFTPEADAQPVLIVQSPEFTTLLELTQWMRDDGVFNRDFYYDETASQLFGTTALTAADLSGSTGNQLFAGGAEFYRAQDLDTVLEAIAEEDNTYFLCDRFGDQAQDLENIKILAHVREQAEFEKFLFIGGGYGEGQLDSALGSIASAQFYNSDRVHVVHSGVTVQVPGGRSRQYSALYHAAIALGRTAGLPPQVPAAFKAIRITGLVHEANKRDRERMLDAGVWHAVFKDEEWLVNQDVNTLQRNDQLINSDATSFSHQLVRIGAQLNKELVIATRTRRDDVGDRAFIGSNRNRASAAEVKAFVEGFLGSRTASRNTDNLIIAFRNVTVRREQESYFVGYGFEPNGPIYKLFYTGVLLDLSASV